MDEIDESVFLLSWTAEIKDEDNLGISFASEELGAFFQEFGFSSEIDRRKLEDRSLQERYRKVASFPQNVQGFYEVENLFLSGEQKKKSDPDDALALEVFFDQVEIEKWYEAIKKDWLFQSLLEKIETQERYVALWADFYESGNKGVYNAQQFLKLITVLASYEARKGNQDLAFDYFKKAYLLTYKIQKHNNSYPKAFFVFNQRGLFLTMMALEKRGLFDVKESGFLAFLQELDLDYDNMTQESVKRDYLLAKKLFDVKELEVDWDRWDRLQSRFPLYDEEEIQRALRELAFDALHAGQIFSYEEGGYMDEFDARCKWEREEDRYDKDYRYFSTYWNDFYHRILHPLMWRKNVNGVMMLCDFWGIFEHRHTQNQAQHFHKLFLEQYWL